MSSQIDVKEELDTGGESSRDSSYDLFILALTLLSIFTIVVMLLPVSPQTKEVVFFVDTLDYLQRGGRIGRAAALIGGILQLKPLLRIDEGQVVPWERTRTRKRAKAGLIDFVKGLPAVDKVAALSSSDPAEGDAFADLLAAETGLPRDQVVVAQIGPTVAAHIGPGAMGVAAVEGGA